MLIQLSSFQATLKATGKATMAGRGKQKNKTTCDFHFFIF
jgi:hypothetical protein